MIQEALVKPLVGGGEVVDREAREVDAFIHADEERLAQLGHEHMSTKEAMAASAVTGQGGLATADAITAAGAKRTIHLRNPQVNRSYAALILSPLAAVAGWFIASMGYDEPMKVPDSDISGVSEQRVADA